MRSWAMLGTEVVASAVVARLAVPRRQRVKQVSEAKDVFIVPLAQPGLTHAFEKWNESLAAKGLMALLSARDALINAVNWAVRRAFQQACEPVSPHYSKEVAWGPGRVARGVAERSGFEPERRLSTPTHLAGGRFRPLSHLSERQGIL